MDDKPEDETVTVPVRVEPVLLADAVIVKLPGVVPLEGDLDNHEALSEVLHDKVLLLPQFVTLIERVPPPDGAVQLLGDTQSSGPDEDDCVTVIVLEDTPEAETVTVPVRVEPVLLADAVIVKPPEVVPLVGDSDSQEALSVTLHDKVLLLPQFVTLIERVPPPDGAVQLLGDTQSSGTGEDDCVTVIVLEDTPEAETVTVPVRVEPVLLADAVIVKLPGVVPLEGDLDNHEALSEVLHDKVLLLPQFVTLIERVPPPDGADQLLVDTHRSGGSGFSAVICTVLLPPFDVMSILPLFEPDCFPSEPFGQISGLT